jgi:hypothetical protein
MSQFAGIISETKYMFIEKLVVQLKLLHKKKQVWPPCTWLRWVYRDWNRLKLSDYNYNSATLKQTGLMKYQVTFGIWIYFKHRTYRWNYQTDLVLDSTSIQKQLKEYQKQLNNEAKT